MNLLVIHCIKKKKKTERNVAKVSAKYCQKEQCKQENISVNKVGFQFILEIKYVDGLLDFKDARVFWCLFTRKDQMVASLLFAHFLLYAATGTHSSYWR